MRFIRLALPLSMALGATACATTQPEPLPVAPVSDADTPVSTAAYEPTFDAARLDAHVKRLSDDSFEGRGPATAGETKTVKYLIDQLTAAGVEPGGEVIDGRRQWTQRVPLLKSDIVGDPVVTLHRGAAGTRLAQGTEVAIRAPMNGQTQVRLNKVPMLFAGYGVTAPERGWDDFKDVDVRGKVIVVLVNDPDFEGGEGDFGGKAMTYYGRWTYKYEEAARRGAAGVIIVHETAPASYGWPTVQNSNTNTMFDIVRADPAKAHAPVNGWIQQDKAAAMVAAAGLNFDTLKAAARRKDFRPVDLKTSMSVTLNAKTEVITSYNVAGRVTGSAYPNETVIYTAHHDHIGVGQPDANGDRIFNGAIDNATGTAHVIEQARAFAAGPKPQRSVLFLFVGAEEKGLLGSEYYASNPLYPLSTTAGVLNTDSMGVYGRARNFSMSGSARFGLLDMMVEEARRRGRSFTPDANPGAGLFFRSDHFPFAKGGVPAISFRSGNDLVEGGTARGEAIGADYTTKRYHQPDDEWQPGWDYTGLIDDAGLLHAVGRNLADSRDWPNWSQDSEFRAARDRSAGERGETAPAPLPAPAAPAPEASPIPGERG
ncbi:M28 family peptidase [Sphingomonas sp. LY160]|uniref:M28 family peptidase n=1 Tax=Sphingomonas sp. LY160 TaxID=3095342 RepID=UPI002ADEE44F|nr:M28 family peptidase [Sphingomonas sp. LY160]MEA1073228.1 M28 family peptidase [Sphingomonas sp. LY160]